MITGAHVVIHTQDPAADRAFFRDALGFDSVDAGGGWLIFALPPSEAAFHPAGKNDQHELYLLCDDLEATVSQLTEKKVICSDPVDEPWGKLTTLKLPGGGQIGLYEPKHPVPHSPS